MAGEGRPWQENKIHNRFTHNKISAVDSMVNLIIKISNSSKNSPTLISPPSSAFYSALQSPYISPRATRDDPNLPSTATTTTTPTTFTQPSTPSPHSNDTMLTVPRISVTKGSFSPASCAKLRSCDVK
ncbi:hypothetical protein L1987_46825 [Smallanthus sonchifolius]|uniref:Uncharacterized protein n=1 Tax=Smallanthus sonchifolius TaxID=185202 RepID=A0ACB9G0P0_9ASTR|nr:hypothetical protein L1987_46825 [Smallanthus sonchifolius]